MAIPQDLVNNIERYFLQQIELCGDELAVRRDVLAESTLAEKSGLMQMYDEIKDCNISDCCNTNNNCLSKKLR